MAKWLEVMTWRAFTGFTSTAVDTGRSMGRSRQRQRTWRFACGKTVYFSEPWGKHSGVEVTFEADMFTVVSSEPAEVATFNRLDLRSGECPLGLLHDAIMDRSMVLADEERDNAPPYFKSALGVVSGASSDP
jgi:hypothetical protein